MMTQPWMIYLTMACLVDPRFKLQSTKEEKREYIKERSVLEMLKGERADVVREEESRKEAMGDASAPAKKTKWSLASFFSNRPTTTTEVFILFLFFFLTSLFRLKHRLFVSIYKNNQPVIV